MSDILSFLEGEGVFRDIASSMQGPLTSEFSDKLISATTIVGVHYGSGVVLGADSQATLGNLDRMREPFKKIIPVGRSAAIGVAGSAGLALQTSRVMQIAVEAEAIVAQEDLSPEHISLIGENLLGKLFSLTLQTNGKMIVACVLAAYDARTDGAELYSIDPLHNRMNHQHTGFVAIGSGSQAAYAALDNMSGRAEDADDALRRTVKALLKACERNAGTGKPLFAVRIDTAGVTDYREDEILAAEEANHA